MTRRFLRTAVAVAAMLLAAPSLHAQTQKGQGAAGPTVADRLQQRTRDPNAKMLVNAREMVYDDRADTVAAVGSVQIHYDGNVLLADRVVYDRKSSKVRAFGNVVLNEPGGNVIRSSTLELTDNFREGFIQSLRVDTVDRAHFVARSAERRDGNVTVFEKGVYSACDPCDIPKKPPLWQIRAARIVHDEKERTVYYEDAYFDFFGQPIAYLPFLSHPDPSVKRKTGFLAPRYQGSTEVGIGIEVPFYWAIRPDMDLTLSPVLLSKQGVLGKLEFRQRLSNGAFNVRAAGILQEDRGAFPTIDANGRAIGAGDMTARGTLQTTGRFDINERWSFGWQGYLVSDKWFLDDYDLWGSAWSEAISLAYLRGRSERNWFELKSYYFLGLSNDDRQKELPIVAPLLDYHYIVDRPVLGGELSFNMNFASLYRHQTDFEPTTAANTRLQNGLPPVQPFEFRGQNYTCGVFITDCIAKGPGGVYTRLSANTEWRRQIIDSLGQVWTPFAYLRGDIIWQDPENIAALANLIPTDQRAYFRGMPAVGLEYRYPFVAASSFGSHQIEPIAQIIVRPNETHVRKLFNEDSQDLFFDDTTLFAWDKFSGYDRVEGGTRANIGAQYTFTFNNGGFLNVLGGQSYQLLGKNSFSTPDLTNTGLDSGLDKRRSDYVSRVYLQATRELAFASRFRFDSDSLQTQAMELETRVNKGPFSGALIYGRFAAQPRIGFGDVREGLLGNTRVSLTKNVFLSGAARYDLDNGRFDATQVGIGYLDESFAANFILATDWSKDGNRNPVHKFLLRLALRTLGDDGTQRNFADKVFGRSELRE